MTHFLLTVFDAPTTRDNYNKHIETQALLEREMRLQAGINSIATSAPLGFRAHLGEKFHRFRYLYVFMEYLTIFCALIMLTMTLG
jgi:hypothetical protein